MLYNILMHISCFMFSASELLLAIYFTCVLVMEMMLDRSKLEQYSYSSSKWVIKQQRRLNINNSFDPGTADECIVQWWFTMF